VRGALVQQYVRGDCLFPYRALRSYGLANISYPGAYRIACRICGALLMRNDITCGNAVAMFVLFLRLVTGKPYRRHSGGRFAAPHDDIYAILVSIISVFVSSPMFDTLW